MRRKAPLDAAWLTLACREAGPAMQQNKSWASAACTDVNAPAGPQDRIGQPSSAAFYEACRSLVSLLFDRHSRNIGIDCTSNRIESVCQLGTLISRFTDCTFTTWLLQQALLRSSLTTVRRQQARATDALPMRPQDTCSQQQRQSKA